MESNSKQHIYDLEPRTAIFGEKIISFCRGIKRDPISTPLITQLVRSATSIGANYMEANGMNSKKEFVYKISLCKKEANETKYWIKMLSPFTEDKKENDWLTQEAHELVLIFQKIASSSKID